MTTATVATSPGTNHTTSRADAGCNGEQPLLFDCAGERLLGMLHPSQGSTGLIVIVGGPQYRAGSHRHFVSVARAVAAAGHPVLRFDVRGMGDSTGPQRSFEEISPDIGAAVQALMDAQPQVRRVALWGLCDGASAALLYLNEHADPRVTGLCLLNPWVRSAQTQARTQVKHYYRQRLLQKGFWLKLARGEVAASAIKGFWANLRQARPAPRVSAESGQPTANYIDRMAAACALTSSPVLLLLSSEDYTAREFAETAATHPTWQHALQRQNVRRLQVADADHTFSTPAGAAAVVQASLDWLAGVEDK